MHLENLVTFKGRKGPLLLVVADGVGLAEAGPANALSIAETPIIDALLQSSLSTRLHAHGTHVGLPTDADMGNSEVGHNTLGGGRVFEQGAKLVNAALENGSIFESDSWREIESRGTQGNTIHFLGLLSDGNVHSHINHLLQLIRRCQQSAIASVCVHALLDGRDVNPRSALHFLAQLQTTLDEVNASGNFNYRIATGGGRMAITMDRYEADWEMVKRGYDTHVLSNVTDIGREASDASAEVQRQYDENPDISDQYLAPFVVVDEQGPVGKMKHGDGVVLVNFRGDRAIEISQAIEDPEFSKFDRGDHPDVYFCGMLQYDGDLQVPENYLVNPPTIENTMVEYMCAENLRTFAVSETQKFGHVTYFWNGNKSGYIDESLETYIEIPSDNCEFNQAPEMKAAEITEATIELLNSGRYAFGRINFANGDMVGHTGDIPATVCALECVDRCLGRLIECVRANKGILIFTADHGNADEMYVEKDGIQIERTSHSLNPVPFVIMDDTDDDAYQIDGAIDGGLGNVAATVFNLMGYRAPEDYLPSLISFPSEPERRTIYRGRVVNLGLEISRMPNDEFIALEVVRHPGGAVVIAMDDDEDLCLIKQYRHTANDWIWEFPAGVLEVHETADETARRELKEETGLTAGRMQALGSMLTTPGFCDERLHVYLATDLRKGASAQEAHEFIEIHWLSLDKVEQLIAAGELVDAKSIVALFKLKQLLST
jgi:2,3-bisphosphoglycerate-independent phosphoglycerate mutase